MRCSTISTFGSEIKKIRLEKNLSLKEVGKNGGISHSYLSQIENGKRNAPKPDMISKLAKGLGVHYEELMFIAGYITERERLFNNDGSLTDRSRRMAQTAAKLNEAKPKNEQGNLVNPEKFPNPIIITKKINVPSEYKIDEGTRKFSNSDVLDLYYLIKMSESNNEVLNLTFKDNPLSNEEKQKILSIIETILQ